MTAPCTATKLNYAVQSRTQQCFMSNGQVLISPDEKKKKSFQLNFSPKGCFQTRKCLTVIAPRPPVVGQINVGMFLHRVAGGGDVGI